VAAAARAAAVAPAAYALPAASSSGSVGMPSTPLLGADARTGPIILTHGTRRVLGPSIIIVPAQSDGPSVTL
jgi:hypothetical protein